MKLYDYNLKILSSQQAEKIPKDEIKIIQKKSGEKSLKVCFPLLSVIILIVILFLLINKKEFPLLYILFFIFLCLPMSIALLKPKEVYACYGTVTDKIVRCAKASGRGSTYIPFEKTEETGKYKHKYTLFQTVCEFYYCTVEINGQKYENICCYREDYPNISIGGKVIIYLDNYNPIVYNCSGKA